MQPEIVCNTEFEKKNLIKSTNCIIFSFSAQTVILFLQQRPIMNKKGSDEATSLGTALSFTDSMELNTVSCFAFFRLLILGFQFSHDTSLLDSTLDANITLDENNSNDNLTNDTSGEIISKHEESCPKISTPMTIRFAEGQTVFLVSFKFLYVL